MKKSILALLLGLTSMTTSAYVIDTEACAGEEYIRDQSDTIVKYDPEIHTFIDETTPVYYAAYENITYLNLSNNRTLTIRVKNISSSFVNFFYRPTYFHDTNGTAVNINPESYYGIFNTSNSPLNSGGANMAPKSFGKIYLSNGNDNNAYDGFASIYWDSSTCMATSPLLTTSETFYNLGSGNSTRSGLSVQLINNGKPW